MSNLGATIHSKKRLVSSLAVGASTEQLIATIPPNALTRSASIARKTASEMESPNATPQGFVCLITTAAF